MPLIAEQTSYAAFLRGDAEDREDDRLAEELEAEKAAIAEAKKSAPKTDEKPHLP